MKRKEETPKKGAPAYMNTYGDMMTLLLTFFILLFAMSTVDAEKFAALVSSFKATVSIFDGGQTIKTDTNILQNGMSQFPIQETSFSVMETYQANTKLDDTTKELQEFVKNQSLEDKIVVQKQGDEIILRFSDVLLFESGKADIKAGFIPTLSALGEELKKYMDAGYSLNVEGHTDNVPIKTTQFPSNWYLSSARAIAVASFYIDEMGFDRTKVACTGSGEFKPIASNDTTEGRANNRRVEIRLSLAVDE